MTQYSRFKEWAIPAAGAAAVLSLGLLAAGCGSGGGGTPAATATASVAGKSTKGPFVSGSVVDLYKADGTTIITANAATTDAYGKYNLSTTASGVTIIRTTGKYFDEYTNATSTGNGSVEMAIDLAPSTAAPTSNVYASVLTTMAAKILKDKVAASGGTTATTADLTAAKSTVATTLGLTKDIDLIDPADPKDKDATAALMVSVLVSQAVANGGALDNVIAHVASNVQNGQLAPAGDIYVSANDVDAVAAALDSYATAMVARSGGTKSTTIATDAAAIATVAKSVNAIDVYGVGAMQANNSYSYVAVPSDGVLTTGLTGAPYSSVVLALNYGTAANKDYYASLVDGTHSMSFTFDLYSGTTTTTGVARVVGSIDKVDVTVASHKITGVSVPADAILSITTAQNTAGNPLTAAVGDYKNLSANALGSVNGNVFSIDLSGLLSTIRSKVSSTSLIDFTANTTYSFKIGFGGIPVGQGARAGNFTKFTNISGTITTAP